jgi:hypothetical protein
MGAALLLLLSPACRAVEENPDPPDSLLRDSLGLGDDDRVKRIRLASGPDGEVVDPSQVLVEPGGYVEFYTRDRRVRTVSFLIDSLSTEQAGFLRSTGQERSPPLVELDSRFVVSFQDAPPGRYPFLVEGNVAPLPGAVVVAGEPPR